MSSMVVTPDRVILGRAYHAARELLLSIGRIQALRHEPEGRIIAVGEANNWVGRMRAEMGNLFAVHKQNQADTWITAATALFDVRYGECSEVSHSPAPKPRVAAPGYVLARARWLLDDLRPQGWRVIQFSLAGVAPLNIDDTFEWLDTEKQQIDQFVSGVQVTPSPAAAEEPTNQQQQEQASLPAPKVKEDLLLKFLAIIAVHGDWTMPQIANELGISRATLPRWVYKQSPAVIAAWESRHASKKRVRRGLINKNGDVDGIDSEAS